MKATIVTSMYNKNNGILDILDKMFFPSLIQNGNKNVEIVIVDDCSPAKEKTLKLIRKWGPEIKNNFADFVFIENKKNLGFAKSFNKGIRKAKGEILLLVNDDIYFPKNSVSRMIKAQEDNLNFGLLGPVTNDVGSATHQFTKYAPKVNSYSGKTFSKFEKFNDLLNEKMPKKILKINLLAGFCFVVKKKILEEEGLFNERYKQGYYEDTELSDKIKEKYNIGIIETVFVSHGGVDGCSNSFKQVPFKLIKSLIANHFRYVFLGKNKLNSFFTVNGAIYRCISKNTIMNKRIKKFFKK